MPTTTSSPTASRRLRLARQPDQLRDPRLDRAPARPVAADLRLHRHRPGRRDDLGGDARPRPALPDRAGPRRRSRLPEDDRQARHPDLDPGRAEVRVLRHQRVGREDLARRRFDRARSHLVGVGEGRPQGPRPARLHPEREHQDARRSIRCKAGARGARCRRRSPGTSSTTRTCGPTAGRSGPSSSAWPRSGDLFAAAQTDAQELPNALSAVQYGGCSPGNIGKSRTLRVATTPPTSIAAAARMKSIAPMPE